MKKRRLTIAVLALLTALLLVLPVVAESTLGNADTEKPPEETVSGEAEVCDHIHESEEAAPSGTVSTVKMSATLCRHPNALSFFDLDTNKTGYLCPDCGKLWEKNGIMADSANIRTSAAIRAACTHVFTRWIRASADHHVRGCTLCVHTEDAPHVRIRETCTTDEYCRDCETTEPGWGRHFDHALVWGYDWSHEDGDYHDQYCVNDFPGIYVCNYVAVEDEPCTISALQYVEPAVDGVHEIFQECTVCDGLTNFEYKSCTASAGYCGWCNRINPY